MKKDKFCITVVQEEYIKEEQKYLKNELLRASEEVKRIQVGSPSACRSALVWKVCDLLVSHSTPADCLWRLQACMHRQAVPRL